MSGPLRVAIVAGGFGWHEAPYRSRQWELWGLNATWERQQGPEKLFSRWFELHRRSFLRWEHGSEEAPHFVWLRGLRHLPVYVQDMEDWKDVPMAQPYPFKRVNALAPSFAHYHTCSIDWMIACAIAEGAKEIKLFGVEQLHSGEPYGSRACVEFWSGFAVARGIKVSSVDGSTFRTAQVVFTDKPYAVDPKWLPYRDAVREDSMVGRMTKRLADVVDGKDLPDSEVYRP